MSRELPIQTTLLKNLTELHLPAMRACFEESARRAEKETLSYEQYLLELTGRECETRDRNRIARLLKESSLPQEKTMANFDLKRLPVKVSRQLKVLLDGGFLDRQENLLLFAEGRTVAWHGVPKPQGGEGRNPQLAALVQRIKDALHPPLSQPRSVRAASNRSANGPRSMNAKAQPQSDESPKPVRL